MSHYSFPKGQVSRYMPTTPMTNFVFMSSFFYMAYYVMLQPEVKTRIVHREVRQRLGLGQFSVVYSD